MEGKWEALPEIAPCVYFPKHSPSLTPSPTLHCGLFTHSPLVKSWGQTMFYSIWLLQDLTNQVSGTQ